MSPIRPNAGTTARYRRALDTFIKKMHKSVLYWLSAQWRKDTPVLAEDASPARELKRKMRQLAKRWLGALDGLSDELAAYFAQAVAERTDAQLKAVLLDHGMTVKFTLSAGQRDALNAIVAENTSLIKSIGSEYMTRVEGAVMRSVATGRDLHSLTEELSKGYSITRRRAEFIARDQNEKSTAALTRVRQLELSGEDAEAFWIHSRGGRKPRPEHVAFSGQRYNVKEGHDFGNGEGRVWPGTAINCGCISRPIIKLPGGKEIF